MKLRVEFYGIPRARSGVATIDLTFDRSSTTLRDVLTRLANEFPRFGSECLSNGVLRPEYSANRNGEIFLSRESAVLSEGDSLIILAADAGG